MVVVHGRRGPNSNINGVYIRDLKWQGQVGPCYRGGGTMGQKAIYLYFEGEWRMGPSPEHGSVWAYARSDAVSPLLIGAPWEVWDGQQVSQDPLLRVSDTSVIPQVLFLSFSESEGVPAALRAAQGMLVQQPGLWDGRPYYRHAVRQGLYLLCSVAEGQWRLGPLPLGSAGRGSAVATLFAHSASALPQEIVESWYVRQETGEPVLLPEGTVRLATTAPVAPRRHPRHLVVVEGFRAAGGVANGVYRSGDELLNRRPVYQKTNESRAAWLWFGGGDWRIGPSTDGGRVWAYAPSVELSPLSVAAAWQDADGRVEEGARVVDAGSAIPHSIMLAGERYALQPKLCDARPVYRRDTQDPGAGEVFLYFLAHQSEWWLGPVFGGTKKCLARAEGSLLQVIPEPGALVWRAPSVPAVAEAAPQPVGETETLLPNQAADSLEELAPIGGLADSSLIARGWLGLLVALLLGAYGMRQVLTDVLPKPGPLVCAFLLLRRLLPGGAGDPDSDSTLKSAPLACVVCLEAPREILLLPCRHVCCCKACADRMERCPMCRSVKTASAKVFL